MAAPCRICTEVVEVRHIELFVGGSEGLNVCHECEMEIVSFVRTLMLVAGKSRKLGYVACKQVHGG